MCMRERLLVRARVRVCARMGLHMCMHVCARVGAHECAFAGYSTCLRARIYAYVIILSLLLLLYPVHVYAEAVLRLCVGTCVRMCV